ncbi:hypothetical protein [Rhodobacter calidifons]|uniref:Uncharacterized protein n=1 Tax=Rhodobacter calidifons TaxID=2715277 RepID=A0ABX0G9M3_9RHOB|nr:hypothetical protein [Rhodobacter calidifons]NHB78008.1 hypothetical protein [Rhodobacter calidifons]
MTENVENLILAQLREIRERLGKIEAGLDDVKTGQQSVTGILIGLGGYIRAIDERVEHIEEKLGIEQ